MELNRGNYVKIVGRQGLGNRELPVVRQLTLKEELLQWYDEEFCIQRLSKDSDCFQFIKCQTDKVVKFAVEKDPKNVLPYIKDQGKHAKHILTILHSDPHALNLVKNQSDQYCNIAVSGDGEVLKYVKDQTKIICELAVVQNPEAIVYVRDQYPRVCKIAVKSNPQVIRVIRNQTLELNQIAITKEPETIRYCIQAGINGSYNMQSGLIYETLVKKDSSYIGIVPKQTEKLIKLALEGQHALAGIRNQTEDICMKALDSNPDQFKWIRNQTPKLCKHGIKLQPKNLQYVIEQTEPLCREAISKNALTYAYVLNQTPALNKLALSSNGKMLRFVSTQTNKLCEIAVKNEPLAIKYVINQTENICRFAIRGSKEAINYVDIKKFPKMIDYHKLLYS